jgi:hypothetical protein
MREVFQVITGIEQDLKYFRVFIRIGTHKLHSEQLNLETAYSLFYDLKKQNIQLSEP